MPCRRHKHLKLHKENLTKCKLFLKVTFFHSKKACSLEADRPGA